MYLWLKIHLYAIMSTRPADCEKTRWLNTLYNNHIELFFFYRKRVISDNTEVCWWCHLKIGKQQRGRLTGSVGKRYVRASSAGTALERASVVVGRVRRLGCYRPPSSILGYRRLSWRTCASTWRGLLSSLWRIKSNKVITKLDSKVSFSSQISQCPPEHRRSAVNTFVVDRGSKTAEEHCHCCHTVWVNMAENNDVGSYVYILQCTCVRDNVVVLCVNIYALLLETDIFSASSFAQTKIQSIRAAGIIARCVTYPSLQMEVSVDTYFCDKKIDVVEITMVSNTFSWQ